MGKWPPEGMVQEVRIFGESKERRFSGCMLVDRGAARYPAKVMDEERFLCHCNLVLSKDD